MAELSSFSRKSRASRNRAGRHIPLFKSSTEITNALVVATDVDDSSQIELVLESVAALKNKQLLSDHYHLIEIVLEILDKHKLDAVLCEKAFEALDAFSFKKGGHWYIRLACTSLVSALQERLLIDYKTANEIEYVLNFSEEIPDQLLGYEGIWRKIFSYHYCSLAENFEVMMKGFIIVNSIAYYEPITLGVSGIAPVIIEASKTFMNKVDFAEVSSEIFAHLAFVDWERSLVVDRSRLVKAGICEYCMSLMMKYTDNTSVSCCCLMVIHNLSQCSNSALRTKLVDVGAVKNIMTAISHNCFLQRKSNIKIAYSAVMAISALTDGYNNHPPLTESIIASFVEHGLCEIIVKLLEKYAKDAVIKYDWCDMEDTDEESVLDYGQGVIRHLAAHNEVNRKRLANLGAGNWLPELF